MFSLADLSKAKRVLCIGAHSDDVEIGCGGTLLRLCKLSPDVQLHWVVFSGSAMRIEEARKSAAAFCPRAQFSSHDFRDGYFPSQYEAIKDRFERLKDLQPDIVFTHFRGDLHQDHALLSKLVWNTFRDHAVLEYEIPKYDGDLGQPNFFVPLEEDVCRRKVELLLQHFGSQVDKQWFDAETFRAMLRLRGVECCSPTGWAEAFHARKITW